MQPPPTADTPDDQSDLSLLEIGTILLRNLRLLILGSTIGGGMCLAGSFLMTPQFTATAQIMVPQQQSSASALLGSLGGLAGSLSSSLPGVRNPADQWIALLRSRTVADDLIDQFKLKNYYAAQYDFQARNSLAGNTRITAGKDGLISIEFDDPDPQQSQRVVDGYIKSLQRLSNQLAVTEASQRRVFFEKQFSDAKDKLVAAEIKLKEARITDGAIKTLPAASIGTIAQLQAQIASMEIALRVRREALTDASPELQAARAQLAALREELRKQRQDKASDADQDQSDYISAYRNFRYFETMYEMMARQYEVARIDEARDGTLIQVVDEPVVPEYKSSPKRGVLAGLGAGASFVLILLLILLHYALLSARKASFAPLARFIR